LNGWMARHGLGVEDLSPVVVEQFFAACRAAGYHHYTSIRGTRPLLAYLRELGLVVEEPVELSPVDELLDRFGDWLLRDRLLAPSSVATYRSHARGLVERVTGPDRVELERLDAAVVRRYVVDVCPELGRTSAKLRVVAIRRLLAFLHYDGAIDRPLHGAVPSVASARLSGLPKRIAADDVRRMLDSCDRSTAIGRRDYAVVMLLARLGVRIGEVADLALDDINWRAGQSTVRGKGRSQLLPLPHAVGDAIAAYLQDGRPVNVDTRLVFMTAHPPARPMCRTGFAWVVVRAAERAGVGHVNPHRLRHTLASEMLAGGADLPSIGQVLGHRMIETTAVYAKGDRETLRRIARPWPAVTT
jgi:integrase/recombinase XerD